MEDTRALIAPAANLPRLSLQELGYAIVDTPGEEALLSMLATAVFRPGEAGRRCLLDDPIVRQVAVVLRGFLVARDLLAPRAKAIQAIAFDKTPDANWKVTWHQDLMFPFARAVTHPGFDLGCEKDGVAYARPPRAVLESLVAVRLHLDACDETNGPLRVAPGTHLLGIIPGAEIASARSQSREMVCTARPSQSLLMKPLLLHASSAASRPGHRRVLHLVYHDGNDIPETWHRVI